MTEFSSIQKNVMRRVRIIHAVRPFVSGAAGATLLFGGSLYLLGREVFVAQIFRNMPSMADLSAVLSFIEAAFFNTTFVVQTLSVLAFIAGVILVREIVRLLLPREQRYA